MLNIKDDILIFNCLLKVKLILILIKLNIYGLKIWLILYLGNLCTSAQSYYIQEGKYSRKKGQKTQK